MGRAPRSVIECCFITIHHTWRSPFFREKFSKKNKGTRRSSVAYLLQKNIWGLAHRGAGVSTGSRYCRNHYFSHYGPFDRTRCYCPDPDLSELLPKQRTPGGNWDRTKGRKAVNQCRSIS